MYEDFEWMLNPKYKDILDSDRFVNEVKDVVSQRVDGTSLIVMFAPGALIITACIIAGFLGAWDSPRLATPIIVLALTSGAWTIWKIKRNQDIQTELLEDSDLLISVLGYESDTVKEIADRLYQEKHPEAQSAEAAVKALTKRIIASEQTRNSGTN